MSIQITNYCAHILEGKEKSLAELKAAGVSEGHLMMIGGIYGELKSAQKFRLPDNGIILGLGDYHKYLREFRGVLRLPYELIAIEFVCETDSYSGGVVVHAFDTGEGIVIIMLLSLDGVWLPFNVYMAYFPEDGDGTSGAYRTLWGDEELASNPDAINTIDIGMRAVVELHAALSCRNVSAEDDPPPAALNKKREARGKQPFFTYKTLVVDAPAVASEKAPRGGTHASPRVHLRRGHIRRLPTGNVWVRAAIVGDKSKGMVHKDYAVRGDQS